jgi:hypothetical protein
LTELVPGKLGLRNARHPAELDLGMHRVVLERKENMQIEHGKESVGGQVGYEAADHALQRAQDYCDSERQHIEAANQPKILALRAEMSFLMDLESDLKGRIHRAPPAGDLRSRRRKSQYYWAAALAFWVVGVAFAIITLDPYRLGWASVFVCAGIALAAPYGLDRLLERCDNPRLIKAIEIVACVAALSSVVLLALIRGEVLMQQIKADSPVVVLGDGSPMPSEPQNNFFNETLPWLKNAMVLLSLTMELGAGLALYEARRLGLDSGEDRGQLAQELGAVQQQMASHVYEIGVLQNEAAVFVTRFWRDFHRAMLNGTARNALCKFSILLLGLVLFGTRMAAAENHMHIVVAVDLSRSVAIADNNQAAEFQKNISAVGKLLTNLPAGSKSTVIGITDNSFAQPDVLLSAEISRDEGYFKERLAAARRQVARAWTQRAARLTPEFPRTDILGGLLVAGELFKQTPHARNILVIFSDMRQQTPALALESREAIPADRLLSKVEQERLIAVLQGVEVYILGVDSAGKSVAYWTELRDFWAAYFRRAGADVKTYSVLRDMPDNLWQ